MDTHNITIYIEGNSYRLSIEKDEEETTYTVIASGNVLEDFAPKEIDWQEDRMLPAQERIQLIEQEQITRIIWTDILNTMEG